MNKEFEKEIRAIRDLDDWGESYFTPVEKSKAASEYLIANAGKPVDFDELHYKFNIKIDKGGMIFPYDTLNWHTHLWLKHKGYAYKLFCIEAKQNSPLNSHSMYAPFKTKDIIKGPGNSWRIKRYILVDKKDEIIWGNDNEKEGRVFNNEWNYYNGAYYY